MIQTRYHDTSVKKAPGRSSFFGPNGCYFWLRRLLAVRAARRQRLASHIAANEHMAAIAVVLSRAAPSAAGGTGSVSNRSGLVHCCWNGCGGSATNQGANRGERRTWDYHVGDQQHCLRAQGGGSSEID